VGVGALGKLERRHQRVALLVGDLALGVDLERAVARQPDGAVVAAHLEVAGTLDGDVERAARVLDRALRGAAADDARGRARAGLDVRAARGAAAAGIEQVLEAHARALVARG